MLRFCLLIYSAIVCHVLANAQCKTVTVDEAGGTATGKLCKKAQRSTYGAKMEVDVRSGEWTFLNEDGVLFKKGSYMEAVDFNMRTGDWQWFDEAGKCFLKVRFKEDKPVQIMAIDSGIAVNGDDSAWVYKPDSAHYRMRFSMKGQHRQWDMETPGEWLEYAPVSTAKKPYKPVVGIVGKNEEATDVEAKEVRENIIWADDELLEMFPDLKKLAAPPMSGISEEQNLIQNPMFKARGKPMKDGTYVLTPGMIDHWSNSEETPDVFVSAGATTFGFRAARMNFETIRGSLKKPLSAGTYYCFSMQVKLKKTNIYALNNIGILVDASGAYRTNKGLATETETGTFLLSPANTPVCLRDSWMTIEGRFKAKGGEKYLYFGHFSGADNIRHWPLDSIFNFGASASEIYYFFKNPVLMAAEKEDMCICNIQYCPEPEPVVNTVEPEVQIDTFVLSAVQFNTGKWELLETSFDALDSLADYLLTHEGYTIEITGHTDDQGDHKSNMALSQKRAHAVYLYLKSKGIAAKRMTDTGKGDTEPIDDNGYEEGRERNRRVEFRVRKGEIPPEEE